ncbi:thioesterase family protein [Vagococcus carniphilus]|uniref:thioesterase family protein n=1 Tax=Vagococcus carniphilus TaxID=218144 RepID=UPI002890845D|nr:thioesterase family protein [Vagococcus carniphilus]MDT2829661.1 thioesterase family protein [Vagococcus carniphilus]MDT2839120.1 thioesterase family protein [Vagococcus carniphilus]MDT2853178.1 thioesterase family protein [Vagococcus carniphilus]
MYQKGFVVSENETAKVMGSGTLDVLATPSAIAMAENTCMDQSKDLVSEGETTVGTHIDFKHIKASLVGANIKVSSEIKEQKGKRIIFSFEMFEGEKKIGYGEHERAIVNVSSFLSHIG